MGRGGRQGVGFPLDALQLRFEVIPPDERAEVDVVTFDDLNVNLPN